MEDMNYPFCCDKNNIIPEFGRRLAGLRTAPPAPVIRHAGIILDMETYAHVDSLAALRAELREFAATRGWCQYHAPKNLAMALIVEAAELVEIFQWQTNEESLRPDEKQRLAAQDEIADVLIYLIEIADVLGVDLLAAVRQKLIKNAAKYPPLPKESSGGKGLS